MKCYEMPVINKFIMCNQEILDEKYKVCFGTDDNDNTVFIDFNKNPHLFIGGCTGSGKTATIQSIIGSLVLKNKPEKCKFLIIDSKYTELSWCDDLLYTIRVVNEMSNVEKELERLNIIVIDRKKDLKNSICTESHIFVVIDELSFIVVNEKIRQIISNIIKYGSKVNVHLIMASQRTDYNFLKDKNNAEIVKLAFKVRTVVDSINIIENEEAIFLDTPGWGLLKYPQVSDFVQIKALKISNDIIHDLAKLERVNNKELK